MTRQEWCAPPIHDVSLGLYQSERGGGGSGANHDFWRLADTAQSVNCKHADNRCPPAEVRDPAENEEVFIRRFEKVFLPDTSVAASRLAIVAYGRPNSSYLDLSWICWPVSNTACSDMGWITFCFGESAFLLARCGFRGVMRPWFDFWLRRLYTVCLF